MQGLIVRGVAPAVLLAAVGCSGGEPAAPATSVAPPPAAKPAPVPGLKAGEAAPKFTLNDQDGKERSLDEFLKSGKVALVFVRSLGSSPHCRQHLVDLRDGRKTIEAAGVQVVGVSPDPVPALKEFVEIQKIPFPVLSDPDGKTARAYAVPEARAEASIAPGTFLLDQKGVIRETMFYPLIQNRVTPSELAEAAQKAR